MSWQFSKGERQITERYLKNSHNLIRSDLQNKNNKKMFSSSYQKNIKMIGNSLSRVQGNEQCHELS